MQLGGVTRHETNARPTRAVLLAVAIQLGGERTLERRAPCRDTIEFNGCGERGLAPVGEQNLEGAKQRGRGVGGRGRIWKCAREVVTEFVPDGERD
jgi:hypothetical protein